MRARRHERLARRAAHPAGRRSRCALPLPGLYNVYNAVAAAATALELGVPLATVGEALEGFGGRLRARGDDRRSTGRQVSILLVKNPAGRQRGAAHADARGRRARPLAGAQRRDRRRARRLLDLGRRLRGARRAGCGARPARARAPRRWRCGSSTRAIGRGAGGRPRPRAARSTPPWRAPPASALYALPTYTALLELRDLLSRRGLAAAVVGVNDAVIWHDVENGGYDGGPRRSGASWRPQAGGPVLDLGRRHRPRGARPGRRRARRHRPGLGRRAARRARAARARSAACGSPAVTRRRPQPRADRPLRARARADAGRADHRRRRRRAPTCWPACARLPRARARPSPPRSPTSTRPSRPEDAAAAAAGRRPRAATGSTRACRSTSARSPAAWRWSGCARSCRPRARSPRSATRRCSTRSRRTSSSARPPRHGLRPVARHEVTDDRGLHRQHGGRMPDAEGLLALSRADEHLRRPRQHRRAAGALRVARARLRARRGHASGEPVDPDAHDLFYMGGGQDRDQIAVARRHGRHQARRPPRRGRPRRGRAGRVRRLPAARALLRARRRGAARASGSSTSTPCASRARG